MQSLPTRLSEWVESIRSFKPKRAEPIQAILDLPLTKRDWAELEHLVKLSIGAVAVHAFAAEVQALADEVDGREPFSDDAGRLYATCPQCGARAPRWRERERALQSVLGSFQFRRTEYRCDCSRLFARADDALGLRERQRMSPWMLTLTEEHGSEKESFREAERDLKRWVEEPPSSSAIREHVVVKASELDAQATQRVSAIRRNSRDAALYPDAGRADDTMVIEIDGGSVPLRGEDVKTLQIASDETGEADNDEASDSWREAKLGAIYLLRDRVEKPPSKRQAARGLPGRGQVLRCLEVARIGHWEESGFAAELYAEAVRLGLHRVSRVIVVADGAPWILHLQQAFFPQATFVLDYWHAMERLCKVGRLVFGEHKVAFAKWREARGAELMAGDIEALCRALSNLERRTTIAARRCELKKEAQQARRYLRKRRGQLRPAEHKAAGLPIGSGLIEGRIKTVIQRRTKNPGMRWSLLGIQAVLRLRTHLRKTRTLARFVYAPAA